MNKSEVIKSLLIVFIVIAGFYYGKEFLMPITIGGVLATLFLPFCNWMEMKKVPKGLASLISILILLGTLAGIGSLLAWQISELSDQMPLIKEKGISILNNVQEYILSNLGISIEQQIKILNDEKPSFSNILQMVGGSLAYVFSNLVLILVYTFFILFYRNHIKQFILKLAPIHKKTALEKLVNSSSKVSQHYLLGLTKMIFCLWILYGVGFSIIGVKNALFFAILCGVLEIVPYLGNIIGTLLTIFVATVQGASPAMVGGILIIYGSVQLFQGWILEPLIVGPHVKINPFSTIIALIVGKLIWGIPGIFLAIPITGVIKIACDHVESLKPYGFLIGEIQSKKSLRKIKNNE